MREVLKSWGKVIWVEKQQKGRGTNFYGTELTLLDMFTIFSLLIALLLIDDVKHLTSEGFQG